MKHNINPCFYLKITSNIFLVSLLFFLLANYLFACPKEPAFLILDYNSGKILNGDNEHTRMQPASLTKLMTLFILFEQLESNKIKLSSNISISKRAASLPPSKLWINPQQTISVKDAINALIVKSANDVAYAIAEYIGEGSEERFVVLMNKKAKLLGLKNTHFANSTGLTHPKQYSTAYDLTMLARFIMFRYPQYYQLFSQKTFKWGNTIYKNTNQLLEYSNIDGLKTGYTAAAGYNLLVSSEINSIRVIITSLGNKTANDRNNIVKQLVNNGIVIAQNFRFNHVFYKDPPQEVLAANNLLQPLHNIKLASNTSINTSLDINIINYNIDNANLISSNNISNLPTENIQMVNYKPQNNTSTTSNKAVINNHNNKMALNIHTENNKKYFLQLGVFSNVNSAKRLSKNVLALEPILQNSNLKIEALHKQNNTFYRVRLVDLSNKEANLACSNLKSKNIACFIGII